MFLNLAIQKTQLTTERTEFQSQLSEGKITLDEYNRKKDDLEKQIPNCDAKLADKQQKLEQKMTELQDIKDKVNFYDVAYVRFDVPEIKARPPMYAAKNSILGERKFRLMNQRDMEKLNEDYHTEKYLRHQQIHETLDLLTLFEKPDTAKLVREVAIALMEVAMSTYLVQVVVLSVARLAGTVARKTRRTRTSDSVVGFMQQRPSRLLDMCRQRGKGMAFDILPPS